MIWLQRLYFWLALFVLTVVFLVLVWPYIVFAFFYSLIGRRDFAAAIRAGTWFYGRVFLFLIRPMVPVHTQNPELARANQPCIITPNHQSFMDIYFFGAQHCTNLCFVVAGWPFKKLFFFAVMMLLGRYIRVGRAMDSLDFYESCRKALDEGAALVCFPEGTRSRTGELQEFRSGIFRVAASCGAPIVPMVYCNTGKLCPPGTFKVNPQPVHIKLLQPMLADATLGGRKAFKELRERVHAAMAATLDEYENNQDRRTT